MAAEDPQEGSGERLVTEGHDEDATITIRCIKSFEHRNVKNLVLRNVNLHTMTEIKTTPGFKPFLNVQFDTLKLHHTAHQSKTNNLVVNEHEELMLLPNRTLYDSGIRNESEISMFNWEAYQAFRRHPDYKAW